MKFLWSTQPYLKVAGIWKYVYRAVDEDMEVIDVYVSDNRDKEAARRFFEICVKVNGDAPESIRSDSHRGYDQ
ncbi:MAG: DDE-type integrase/transposase/recombinase, partial [Chloroflexi bacterium]|nr:DDE-type integrase/transposase/recombinase [Chloroflexota bacterium]